MRYEVKAVRSGEAPMAFALEAADFVEVMARLKLQGLRPIAVKARRSWPVLLRRRRPAFPLVLFSQELLALLNAGLQLVEALESLAEKEQRPGVKATLNRISAGLYEGRSLSQALEQSAHDFPPLFIATVRASEKTGALSEALLRYIAYQTQMDGVKRQVISASIYPALLGVVGALVTLFLMAYVVPRFSHVYADLGSDLPMLSRLLMRWGQLLESHGLAVLGVFALLVAALFVGATRRPARRWFLARLWQLPSIGERLRLYQLARFYRSLGMLLRGGMPALAALQLVSGLLQETLRARLALASTSIREGGSISRAMEQHGLGTAVALRMLRVGERTGQMGEMMERIAAFHEEEMARWVERFTRLFEPLLMILIGLVIGLIVVLMYFPIFELAGSIQ